MLVKQVLFIFAIQFKVRENVTLVNLNYEDEIS